MSNTFSAKRFGFLFKKTLFERPMQMFGFTGLILAIIFIMYFTIKSLWGFEGAQVISFVWGLAGGGCFLASVVFGYFYSNASGSSYLTLPASHFEKWLCGILISGILYPFIFLLFFRLMDAGFVAIYHHSLDPGNPLYKIQYDSVYLFSFTGMKALKVYPIYLLFTGVALIGSLYFNKAGFIKTAICFCVVCFGLFAVNWIFASVIFGNIEGAFPFHGVDILVGKEVGSIELPKKMFQAYSYAADFIVPIIFWILAYIRLREKEF
jgi:hypothetical protein